MRFSGVRTRGVPRRSVHARRRRSWAACLVSLGMVLGSVDERESRAQPILVDDPAAPSDSAAQVDGSNEAPSPVTLEALRLTLSGGRVLLGLDGGQICDTSLLIIHGAEIPIPNRTIELRDAIVVDALSLAQPRDIYERLQRMMEFVTADDWFSLGRCAEALGLPIEVKKCFAKALEIDPEFARADLIRRRLALFDSNEAVGSGATNGEDTSDPNRAEAEALLQSIVKLHVQKKHAAALDAVIDFYARFPQSSVRDDVAKRLKTIVEDRRKAKVAFVQTEFFPAARRLCEKRAGDVGSGIDAAKEWARSQCFSEALRAVAMKHDIDGECEAFDLWMARNPYASGAPVCYGPGTFVIEYDAGNVEVASIAPSPDEWWRSTTTKSKDRADFLFAYFGEFAQYDGRGGLIEVMVRASKPCSVCAGLGVVRFRNTHAKSGPSEGSKPCERCKKLGADRAISLK